MRYQDNKNRFVENFNLNTGFYIRTGVIDEQGNDTGIDPFMRNFPMLIDVGIMGSCKNKHLCKVGCYQGSKQYPNMTLENFKKIVDESKGKVFELALGGNGDPNHHEAFKEIVEYTVENNIVPNYTTSGILLSNEQVELSKKCGAVAVSWYKTNDTFKAIDKFIKAGCKTNIHYVLSKSSIDEAINMLENNAFPTGINAVIFLLYKPVGNIIVNNTLQYDDPRLKRFFETLGLANLHHKIGFDACTIPALLNFTDTYSKTSMTPCDGGSFSMYITHDMIALPCSFDNQQQRFPHDLKGSSIAEAWRSESFEKFRNWHRYSCPKCPDQNTCRGGCPIVPEINLCRRNFFEIQNGFCHE